MSTFVAAAALGVAARATTSINNNNNNNNVNKKIQKSGRTNHTRHLHDHQHHKRGSDKRRVVVVSASSGAAGDGKTADASTSCKSVVADAVAVDVGVLSRRAAVGAAAAAILSLASSASPVVAVAASSDASFGNALLLRRQVEETAAQASLNGIMSDIREEEAKLKALRFEREAESMSQLNARREVEEQKARQQVIEGKTLCITPFGIDFVGITETVALVGAIGAGLTSNARKAEIAELNEKLRTINVTLRQQIRNPGAMTVYPDGGTAVNRSVSRGLGGVVPGGLTEVRGPNDSIDDVLQHDAGGAGAGAGAATNFESESVVELKQALREGRSLLKEGTKEAFSESTARFKKALMLGRMVGDRVQVRRAVRGLSASKRGMGDRKGAIADLKEVLAISKEIKNTDGDTDALGAIADIYTELGDLENAGRYYDLYLAALNDELSTQMDSE